jgi:hypothetical protein
MYSHDRSAYSAAGKQGIRSSEYMNSSQIRECGIWTEVAQFLFGEYINRIFFAVGPAVKRI